MSEAATIDLPTAKMEERPDCSYCGARAGELVELAPSSNHFVPRCARCLEIPAEPDEEHLSRNGKPAFDLTVDQRKAIFAGDHTALKLEPGQPKPEVEAGQVIVLAKSKGGKQFLAKTESERQKLIDEGLPLLTEIPSEPTVWVVLHEPKLKEGRWRVSFDAHDTREPVRTLAAAPTGNRQPGLKTRLKKRVTKKGEYKPPNLSDDAARGYGGGGKSTVDEREGIDDTTLDRYRLMADEENIKRRTKQRQADKAVARERRVAEGRKRKLATAGSPVSVSDTAAPLQASADVV